MTARPPDNAAAACIAHDVTNLLSAIMAAADAALARPTDPECRADLLLIRANARRSAARLQRLLPDRGATAVRHALPELRSQSIDAAIEAIADTLRYLAGSDVHLELTYGAPGQLVLLDVDDLHDALLNLTMNARDAMAGKGTLALLTSVHTVPATPDLNPAGCYVSIELRDSGPGLPPELRQRVFEPYFTTKQPGRGSGLGLHAVREMARRHSGFVALDDAPDGGTAVRLYLPAANEKPPSGNGRLVLLVEDEPTLRRMAARALTGHGWRVVAAEDGGALLTLLSRNLATGDRPAVLISDVALPGLDASALVQAVRRTWPELPVLLVSGYARTNLPSGLDRVSFLRKPFGVAELINLVASTAETGLTESESSCIVPL